MSNTSNDKRNLLRLVTVTLLVGFLDSAFSAEGLAPVAERIVAVVNGQIIFLSDIDRYRTFFQKEGMLQSMEAAIDHQVNQRLLLEEAKRFVLEPPSEREVQTLFTDVQQRFRGRGQFEAALYKAGMNREELRERIVDLLWVNALLRDRIQSLIFVTDDEVLAYYQQHQNDFPGKTLKEAGEAVRSMLERQKERTKTDEYLGRLRSQAEIQIIPSSAP